VLIRRTYAVTRAGFGTSIQPWPKNPKSPGFSDPCAAISRPCAANFLTLAGEILQIQPWLWPNVAELSLVDLTEAKQIGLPW